MPKYSVREMIILGYLYIHTSWCLISPQTFLIITVMIIVFIIIMMIMIFIIGELTPPGTHSCIRRSFMPDRYSASLKHFATGSINLPKSQLPRSSLRPLPHSRCPHSLSWFHQSHVVTRHQNKILRLHYHIIKLAVSGHVAWIFCTGTCISKHSSWPLMPDQSVYWQPIVMNYTTKACKAQAHNQIPTTISPSRPPKSWILVLVQFSRPRDFISLLNAFRATTRVSKDR